MRSNDQRRPDRYATGERGRVRIHPLKYLVRAISRFFSKRARFFIFGLPARDEREDTAVINGIATIPEGIASSLGGHLTGQGRYLPELTLGTDAFIEERFLKKQRCFPKIIRGGETIVSLGFEAQLNYYRWLMENLPRLRFLKDNGLSCLKVYACQKRLFHRESLHLLLPPGAEIVASEETPYVQASHLIVPRFVDENEPWVIPWLREQVEPLLAGRPARNHPRRLYISRQKAAGRRMANERELEELLTEFGFASIFLEDYGWLDQIELFRGAEAIIGPHGAGFANTVFCRSALVLEMIADDYPFTFYPQISHRIGLEHHCVSCQPVAPEAVNASDLSAPLNLIRERLRASLG